MNIDLWKGNGNFRLLQRPPDRLMQFRKMPLHSPRFVDPDRNLPINRRVPKLAQENPRVNTRYTPLCFIIDSLVEMSSWLILAFLAIVLAILALDLAVFHRRTRPVPIRAALIWSGFWVLIALLFAIGVYYIYEYRWLGASTQIGQELSGKQAALQFLG